MPRLLRIDASARLQGSQSRALADYFVAHWRASHAGGEVVVRDLVSTSIPHIDEQTIAGFYTPTAEHDDRLRRATALSDTLISELMAADTILIDTPMYNFSIPSALKAWIDQIVRIGVTFSFSPDSGFQGLVQGKHVYLITAAGAVFSSEAMQSMDFMTSYLRTLLGFLGMSALSVLALEGTNLDPAAFERSRQAATLAIDALWARA